MRRIPNLVKNAIILRKKLTPWELKLWQHLRAGRFGGFKFKRQVPIENYIVDFCCNQRKIIIELDGSHHQFSESDKLRDRVFTSLGYKVLRFWNNNIDKNIEGVLETIQKALK